LCYWCNWRKRNVTVCEDENHSLVEQLLSCKSAVIVFVVKRNTLEKAALDLEIFITFQAATDMAEFWIIYSSSPTSPATQRQSKRFRKGSERSCFAQIQRLDTCQNLPTEFGFPLCNSYFCHFSEIQLPMRKLLYKSCLSVFLLIPTAV
jgi:hypothetical protein